MLTLTILLILFIGAYSGSKNGMVIGLIRTIGYTISFIFAMNYYKALSKYIYLIVPYPSPFSPSGNPYHYYPMDFIFSLDRSYYYLISILTILVLGWLITRILSQLLSYFMEGIVVPEPLNRIGGAVIGFVVNYLSIFLFLFILTTIPYDFIQNRLSESWLANSMITSTAVVSERSYQAFIENVHQEELENQPLMDIEAIMNPEESTE